MSKSPSRPTFRRAGLRSKRATRPTSGTGNPQTSTA